MLLAYARGHYRMLLAVHSRLLHLQLMLRLPPLLLLVLLVLLLL